MLHTWSMADHRTMVSGRQATVRMIIVEDESARTWRRHKYSDARELNSGAYKTESAMDNAEFAMNMRLAPCAFPFHSHGAFPNIKIQQEQQSYYDTHSLSKKRKYAAAFKVVQDRAETVYMARMIQTFGVDEFRVLGAVEGSAPDTSAADQDGSDGGSVPDTSAADTGGSGAAAPGAGPSQNSGPAVDWPTKGIDPIPMTVIEDDRMSVNSASSTASKRARKNLRKREEFNLLKMMNKLAKSAIDSAGSMRSAVDINRTPIGFPYILTNMFPDQDLIFMPSEAGQLVASNKWYFSHNRERYTLYEMVYPFQIAEPYCFRGDPDHSLKTKHAELCTIANVHSIKPVTKPDGSLDLEIWSVHRREIFQRTMPVFWPSEASSPPSAARWNLYLFKDYDKFIVINSVEEDLWTRALQGVDATADWNTPLTYEELGQIADTGLQKCQTTILRHWRSRTYLPGGRELSIDEAGFANLADLYEIAMQQRGYVFKIVAEGGIKMSIVNWCKFLIQTTVGVEHQKERLRILAVSDPHDKTKPMYKACCLGAIQGQTHDYVISENQSRRLGPNDVLAFNALVHYTLYDSLDAIKLKSIGTFGLQPMKTYKGKRVCDPRDVHLTTQTTGQVYKRQKDESLPKKALTPREKNLAVHICQPILSQAIERHGFRLQLFSNLVVCSPRNQGVPPVLFGGIYAYSPWTEADSALRNQRAHPRGMAQREWTGKFAKPTKERNPVNPATVTDRVFLVWHGAYRSMGTYADHHFEKGKGPFGSGTYTAVLKSSNSLPSGSLQDATKIVNPFLRHPIGGFGETFEPFLPEDLICLRCCSKTGSWGSTRCPVCRDPFNAYFPSEFVEAILSLYSPCPDMSNPKVIEIIAWLLATTDDASFPAFANVDHPDFSVTAADAFNEAEMITDVRELILATPVDFKSHQSLLDVVEDVPIQGSDAPVDQTAVTFEILRLAQELSQTDAETADLLAGPQKDQTCLLAGDVGMVQAMSDGPCVLSENALAIAQAQTAMISDKKRNTDWQAFKLKLAKMKAKQKKGYFCGAIGSEKHSDWENKQLKSKIQSVWFRPQYDSENFPQALEIVTDRIGRKRLGSMQAVVCGQFNADMILACCIDRITFVADYTVSTAIRDFQDETLGNLLGGDKKLGDYTWLICLLHEGEVNSQAVIRCALENDAATIMELLSITLDSVCMRVDNYRELRQFFPAEVLFIFTAHICEWMREHVGHWEFDMIEDGTDVVTILEDSEVQSSRSSASTMSLAAPSQWEA